MHSMAARRTSLFRFRWISSTVHVQGGEEGLYVGGQGEVVLPVGLLGVDGGDLVA
jgi:hypothetical protein